MTRIVRRSLRGQIHDKTTFFMAHRSRVGSRFSVGHPEMCNFFLFSPNTHTQQQQQSQSQEQQKQEQQGHTPHTRHTKHTPRPSPPHSTFTHINKHQCCALQKRGFTLHSTDATHPHLHGFFSLELTSDYTTFCITWNNFVGITSL